MTRTNEMYWDRILVRRIGRRLSSGAASEGHIEQSNNTPQSRLACQKACFLPFLSFKEYDFELMSILTSEWDSNSSHYQCFGDRGLLLSCLGSLSAHPKLFSFRAPECSFQIPSPEFWFDITGQTAFAC